jgi:hypothetical protein
MGFVVGDNQRGSAGQVDLEADVMGSQVGSDILVLHHVVVVVHLDCTAAVVDKTDTVVDKLVDIPGIAVVVPLRKQVVLRIAVDGGAVHTGDILVVVVVVADSN